MEARALGTGSRVRTGSLVLFSRRSSVLSLEVFEPVGEDDAFAHETAAQVLRPWWSLSDDDPTGDSIRYADASRERTYHTALTLSHLFRHCVRSGASLDGNSAMPIRCKRDERGSLNTPQ